MVKGLYAMKIPRAFVITFAVAMRFFPTAKEEISYVRDAMSLRGIGFSLRNLRLRPALVFEGFITPLLVRASTIAEELSAASITRGLDKSKGIDYVLGTIISVFVKIHSFLNIACLGMLLLLCLYFNIKKITQSQNQLSY